jgi:hypothetical protein
MVNKIWMKVLIEQDFLMGKTSLTSGFVLMAELIAREKIY